MFARGFPRYSPRNVIPKRLYVTDRNYFDKALFLIASEVNDREQCARYFGGKERVNDEV